MPNLRKWKLEEICLVCRITVGLLSEEGVDLYRPLAGEGPLNQRVVLTAMIKQHMLTYGDSRSPILAAFHTLFFSFMLTPFDQCVREAWGWAV